MLLNDKVIIISGGSGLIGSALARGVLTQGANVVLVDLVDKNAMEIIEEFGLRRVIFVRSDVTSRSAIESIVSKAVDAFGKIDSAIHAAYPRSEKWGAAFEDLEEDGLSRDLFGQLGGAIIFSQGMMRYFVEHGGGALLHFSSIMGIRAPKFNHYVGTNIVSPIEYSAIKSGVIAITRYLAKYYKGKNIRVNCISPGGVLDGQPQQFLDEYKLACLSKGMLEASDLVGTAVFLLSDQSEYINGQNIVLDDGWSL